MQDAGLDEQCGVAAHRGGGVDAASSGDAGYCLRCNCALAAAPSKTSSCALASDEVTAALVLLAVAASARALLDATSWIFGPGVI